MDVLLLWGWEWLRSWLHLGVQVFTQVCSLERSCSSWAEKQEPGWAILQCWAPGVCFPHLIPAGNSRRVRGNVGGDGRQHSLVPSPHQVCLFQTPSGAFGLAGRRSRDEGLEIRYLTHGSLTAREKLLSGWCFCSSRPQAPPVPGGLLWSWVGPATDSPWAGQGLLPPTLCTGEGNSAVPWLQEKQAGIPHLLLAQVSSLSLGRVSVCGVLVISEAAEGGGGEESLGFSFSLVFQGS